MALDEAVINLLNTVINDGEKSELLTRFVKEKEIRPRLVSLITIPELMYDYLEIPEEEKENLNTYQTRHTGFLEGENKGMHSGLMGLGNNRMFSSTKKLAMKIRLSKQLIQVLDFYLKYNKDNGKPINNAYLFRDEDLNKELNNLGKRLTYGFHQWLYNPKELGLNQLVNLVSQVRPEIKEYYGPYMGHL